LAGQIVAPADQGFAGGVLLCGLSRENLRAGQFLLLRFVFCPQNSVVSQITLSTAFIGDPSRIRTCNPRS